MPNDFMTLSALCGELNSTLCGGKIEKIYQPEKDEISLLVRIGNTKRTLVISCNAQNPRLHLTDVKKENPATAPTFCMHLRKLINNGVIQSVSMANCDRIINITIISKNELKDTVSYSIVFEMMGRYSNILLINDKGVITDAVKQVSFDNATKRVILPGMQYSYPEQSKLLPTDTEGIRNVLRAYESGDLARYISATISGLAPITSEEAVYRLSSHSEPLSESETDRLCEIISQFFNVYGSNLFAPCVLINDNGIASEYFAFPYRCLAKTFLPCQSMCEAVEKCVRIKDENERHKERTKHLVNALKKFKARNEKKLQKEKEKLLECEKMETYRKWGELITSNIYAISKGDTSLVTTDYYEEDMPKITIPLNPQLSPAKCAQDYFKRYNKLKRTLAVVSEQLTQTEELIEYAGSIQSSLISSTSSADLMQVEEELFNIGALKKLKNKRTKQTKEGKPLIYKYKDYLIAVGKNNLQNDKLTFKSANGGDLWLHTLGYHGSHVIVFSNGGDFDEEVILFAAELAAFYSIGKDNEKVAVDYTLRRNVKRNPKGIIGLVTYTGQRTLNVSANDHKEYLTE